MNNGHDRYLYIKIILAYLLGQPLSPKTRASLLVSREAQTVLTEIALLVQNIDDPAWLEDIAAASEGHFSTTLAVVLTHRDMLRDLGPDLMHRLEHLTAPAPANLNLRPEYPTFAERWHASHPAPAKPAVPTTPPFDWRAALFGWRSALAVGVVALLLFGFLTVLVTGMASTAWLVSGTRVAQQKPTPATLQYAQLRPTVALPTARPTDNPAPSEEPPALARAETSPTPLPPSPTPTAMPQLDTSQPLDRAAPTSSPPPSPQPIAQVPSPTSIIIPPTSTPLPPAPTAPAPPPQPTTASADNDETSDDISPPTPTVQPERFDNNNEPPRTDSNLPTPYAPPRPEISALDTVIENMTPTLTNTLETLNPVVNTPPPPAEATPVAEPEESTESLPLSELPLLDPDSETTPAPSPVITTPNLDAVATIRQRDDASTVLPDTVQVAYSSINSQTATVDTLFIEFDLGAVPDDYKVVLELEEKIRLTEAITSNLELLFYDTPDLTITPADASRTLTLVETFPVGSHRLDITELARQRDRLGFQLRFANPPRVGQIGLSFEVELVMNE